MVAVGVGSRVNQAELNGITNDPSSVFTVNSFDNLDSIKSQLLQKMCSSKFVSLSYLFEFCCIEHSVKFNPFLAPH